VARTAQAKLHEWFSIDDYSGASVTARLDAAITAANGNLVIIPASVGAGEPTTWPLNSCALDMRGANGAGSGRKVGVNLSDPNGQNILTVMNDVSSYSLSSAAVLGITRAIGGSLPDNRNLEGMQTDAGLIGAVTGGGAGFILCGIECGVNVASTGAVCGFAWGASVSVTLQPGATTAVTEIAGVRTVNVQNNSGTTPALMFGLIADQPTGAATKKGSIFAKGDILLDGVFAVNTPPITIASAGTIAPEKAITFVSGVAAISTITPPPSITAAGTGEITLIPTGAWTINTAGNSASNVTAVTGRPLRLIFASGQWYPAY